MKGIAACVLACMLLCGLSAPPVHASDGASTAAYGELWEYREEAPETASETAGEVSVLPPPPSSEHGLCGGAYCETTPYSAQEDEPDVNPATGVSEDGTAAALLCGGLALTLPLLLLLLRRGSR